MVSTMIVSTFLVLSCLLGALGAPLDETRIIGGYQAVLGQFPEIVSLQHYGTIGGHFCAGTILDSRRILTAAHCIYKKDPEDIQVIYAVVDNEDYSGMIPVEDLVWHEKYVNGSNYPNDIAILTLVKDMELDGITARATVLPDSPAPIVGAVLDNAKVTGWGLTKPENVEPERMLKYTNIPIFSPKECKKRVPKFDAKYHTCAGTMDGKRRSCSGDSGGPLFYEGVQYGIVSWGYDPCTIKNIPTAYVNLPNYREWIRGKTGL